VTFRKVSLWQHAATYLLYFVMLMNVFVTTFGISGSVHSSVFGGPAAAAQLHSTVPPTTPAPSATVLPQSTTTSSTMSALLVNVTSTPAV